MKPDKTRRCRRRNRRHRLRACGSSVVVGTGFDVAEREGAR